MNAIKFLITEHDRFRKALADIAQESHRIETKQKMFLAFSHDLERHEKMEEKTWYPKLTNDKNLDEIISHLITEEKKAGEGLKEINKVKDPDHWETLFAKLKHDIGHHADEEEQKLFPKVEKMLSEQELEDIGKDMLAFKQSYKE